MASYDREILIPYLQNLCSLHLLRKKMENEYNKLNVELKTQIAIQSSGTTPSPKIPETVRISGGWIPAIIVGMSIILPATVVGFGALAGYLLKIPGFESNDSAGAGAIFFVVGLFLFFLLVITPIRYFFRAKRRNKANMIAYRAECEAATLLQEKEKSKAKNNVVKIKNRMKLLEQSIMDVTQQLNQVYSVNIIPKPYRNIYASIYLYDWFSTSAATDLEQALNMFVLEEMKDDLDVVIRNQTGMILQQQVAISRQESHAAALEEHLHQLQVSAEEQVRYSQMIAASASASAFFAESEYLKGQA